MFLSLRRFAALLAVLVLLASSACAEEALDILLIGVDAARAGEQGRSDTMMLARVDAEKGEVRLASFLRDLYVSIPGHGRTRLNAAYFYGGEELLRQTLEKNFGVEVDRTVTVHFSVLADLVDQLGGVEIEITEAERKHLNHLLEDYGTQAQPLEKAGLQQLGGLQALCYSRIRKLDSDFQRTSRQQTVIAAMLQQMAAMDRWPLLKLAVRSLSRVQTDVSLGDLSKLVPLAAKLGSLDIRTAHVPFEGAYTDETVNGMMVLKPNLEKNTQLLQKFLTE